MKVHITNTYNSDDSALKTGFAIAHSLGKNENYAVLDIVIPTFDSISMSLLSFLGSERKKRLEKNRATKFGDIQIVLHSNATVKKLNDSSCMLLLCTSDGLLKDVKSILPKHCVVVPRQDSNKEFWQRLEQA
ncbi:hypothetical protein L4D16_00050 [Vibrio alginolyticus]|uniref:hypothetical protein n=1 Tax=Vibrio TaxID=662 RepID=UPI0005F1EE35|nr:hypothetical protein [Vibrio vulnificus]EHH1220608.1 hypothetical protein [Vibrio parahaemolyticus]ELA8139278.1 hypothetical protein [Vibrio parahaemolyticus]